MSARDGSRNVHLEGYYKAEKYLDAGRLTKIRDKITPDLSRGNYQEAFEKYIKTAHRYMGFEPDVNPDNILFNIWFQLGVAAPSARSPWVSWLTVPATGDGRSSNL